MPQSIEATTVGDQRSSVRARAPLRCCVREGDVWRYTQIADLSVTGARVHTAKPPPVGNAVTLSFRLNPRGDEIRTQASVVWRCDGFRGRGGVMGVRFLDTAGSAVIASYLGQE